MGLTTVNIICWNCGRDQLIEDDLMNDDELECGHCGVLIHDEPDEE